MMDYCVYILSYKRADKVETLRTLEKEGYTGSYYIVCGDDEPELDNYKSRYGDKVVVFDKERYMESVDTIDDNGNKDCVVYARNAVFDIAKDMGFDFFVMLDDDYKSFEYRTEGRGKLLVTNCKNLDKAFEASFEFLIESGADVVAWAQGGDFIGGKDNATLKKRILRKVYNTFFCRTDRPLDFIGSTNEDECYSVNADMRGRKIFTVVDLSVRQQATQSRAGGLTDIYLRDGTYVKSFYPVICQPSCVKIGMMGDKHKRIHHKVDWNYCAPMILNEKYKKGDRNGETL